jgi:predicted ATPase
LHPICREPGPQARARTSTLPTRKTKSVAHRPSPVTFLVGENGCGKSTLLEGIACAAGSIAVGSQRLDDDTTLDAVRDLGRRLKLTWSVRTQRGFFLRAEDFFGYATRMAQLREALQRYLARLFEEP